MWKFEVTVHWIRTGCIEFQQTRRISKLGPNMEIVWNQLLTHWVLSQLSSYFHVVSFIFSFVAIATLTKTSIFAPLLGRHFDFHNWCFLECFLSECSVSEETVAASWRISLSVHWLFFLGAETSPAPFPPGELVRHTFRLFTLSVSLDQGCAGQGVGGPGMCGAEHFPASLL